MSKQDFMINLQADLMLSMALAMIKQKCSDTTVLAGMNMNLGEWKSMMKLTPEELNQLEEMD